MADEHRHRKAHVFQFLAISNRAAGESAGECANGKVRAFGVAGGSYGYQVARVIVDAGGGSGNSDTPTPTPAPAATTHS